jgi:hypothetical protein
MLRMLGSSFTSAPAIVLYVIGTLVIIGTFVEQQYKAWGWLRERFFRNDVDEALPPVLLLRQPSPPPPPRLPAKPFVTIKPLNTELNFEPPMQDVTAGTRRLSAIGMNFDVQNEDVRPVRDVTAGVCTRDGREVEAPSFHMDVIGPQKAGHVRHFAIPDELVIDVTHESWPNFFLLWARFTDHAGHVWKVTHDRSLDTHRETCELIEL